VHDEITADYNDMIYAITPEEIEVRCKAFICKWRLKHRAVADSLEEAGERLFTFTRLPPSQWRSVRTTNAIERLQEEFKRRIKTQSPGAPGNWRPGLTPENRTAVACAGAMEGGPWSRPP
jgi:putative transposase